MCIIMFLGFMVAGLLCGNDNYFMIAAVFGIGVAIEMASSRIVITIREVMLTRIIDPVKKTDDKTS